MLFRSVDGVVVTVYDVGAGLDADGELQDKLTDPPVPLADASDVVFAVARYGLFVPTFVAVRLLTASGCKKSFACCECLPNFLFAILLSYYADRSP